MKKKWLILLLVFILSGCAASSGESGFFSKSVSDFKAKYACVQEKIVELLDDSNLNVSANANTRQKTPTARLLDTDSDTIYYPEDFLAIYNSAAQTTDPASSMEFIREYYMLLEELRTLVDFDNLVLEEALTLISSQYGEISVTFYNVLDGHILIRVISADRNEFLKFGFTSENLFHLVHFSYCFIGEQVGSATKNVINYNYEDFVEDTAHVLVNSLEGDWIGYSFYDIPGRNQAQYGLHNGVENIQFYDLETGRTFYFAYLNGVKTAQEIIYKNEKGFIFGYLEGDYVPAGYVQICWQLLEATGWDYAIVQNMPASNIQEGDGVFKDGENLYINGEDRLNISLDPWFANVWLAKKFPKSALTNEILNLSAYGMTFSFDEVSIDLINQSLQEGKQMIDEKITYNGVYFRSETIKTDVLSLLDPDIQSLIAFLSDNE